MKHTDKRIRRDSKVPPHMLRIPVITEHHHYPKGYPKSFSQLYSDSLSAHAPIDSNIGKKIGT
jgi:hypothetical protein